VTEFSSRDLLGQSSRESIAAWATMGVLAAVSSAIGDALIAGRFTWAGLLAVASPFLSWTLVSPLVVLLAMRVRNKPILEQVSVHAGGFLILSMTSFAVAEILCRCAHTIFLGREAIVRSMLNLLMYGGVVSTVRITGELAKAAQHERRTIELDAGVDLQHVRLVQSRIPTAFLTDAFDALERLLFVSPAGAERLILRLAAFLRRLLAALSAVSWPVEKELELVSDYVAVSAAKREEEPDVLIEVDDAARNARVSAGAFQASLFRASAALGQGGGVSKLSAVRSGEQIALSISNALGRADVFLDCEPILGEAKAASPHRLPENRNEWSSLQSPSVLAIAAVLVAGVIAIGIQMTNRFAGFSRAYLPYALLRTALWLVPLLIVWTLSRTTRPRWWLCVATAFFSSLAGEVSFLTILHRMRALGIPAPLTPAMLSMALTSLVIPLIVTLPLLLILEGIRVSRSRLDREVGRIHSESELAAAQMEVLRSQLHPHFLFNALNSLATLVRNDQQSSLHMLQRLRDFYRSAETTAGHPFITLTEEIRLVRQYLEIEQVRFGNRLNVVVDVDASVAGARVPALFLQPIAENAIHHGVSRITGPAWVRLSATSSGERIRITMANSGRHGTPSRAGAGLGLLNTRERLARMFSDDFALDWVELADASVVVTIDLPRLRNLPTYHQ
jgi:hypothetical protein